MAVEFGLGSLKVDGYTIVVVFEVYWNRNLFLKIYNPEAIML